MLYAAMILGSITLTAAIVTTILVVKSYFFIIPAFLFWAAGFICLVLVDNYSYADYWSGKHYVESHSTNLNEAISAYNRCVEFPDGEEINNASEWKRGCLDGARQRGIVFTADGSILNK